MKDPKHHKLAILGSTGSIGKQTLEIVNEHPERFSVEVLTANSNADLLISQAVNYKPNAVVIGDKALYKKVNEQLSPHNIKVFAGHDAICQIVTSESITLVLNALVGFSGFVPTIQAIKSGKMLALANKESLVVGGEYVMKLLEHHHSSIIPVDSEHSAILQCLVGESANSVEKIYLTASGGPFRKNALKELSAVTREQALDHPNWNMGKKITIDSASMMNKGFEVIEAKWLFGLHPEQIEVVIHPQSIIHSIVQFIDGSMKAQMGLPDMRTPIQYSMFFPDREPLNQPRFSFSEYPELTFEKPDLKKFRNLALAFAALEDGGTAPCALNAANEVVVDAFLTNKIGFLDMPVIIERCLDQIGIIKQPGLDDYITIDQEARKLAWSYIK